MADEDDDTECERLGCDDELTSDEDGVQTYMCRRCGAEWWEDTDD